MASKTTVQEVKQTTSNIGAAQLPFYNTAMQSAQGLLTAQTPLYDRERLEGFTPQQLKLQGEVAGMQTPGQFGQATNFAQQAGLGVLNTGNYTPGQFQVDQVNNPELQQYQMAEAEKFGNQQAQQYMSPYVQNVLDIQKREAQQDAQRTQLMQNLGAARQGTYGGSRQLLAGLGRERALGQNLSDIEAKGLQSAYENAQAQFNADRAAGFSVNEANLRAKLGVQDLGARNSLAAQQANQQYNLEGQRLGEQSRQFGATQDLNKYKTAGDMAQTLANIGQTQQQADVQRLGLQQQTAAQTQALEQQKRDLDYQDFLEQKNDPYKRLQQYMNILSGVPQATSTTQTTSAPSPSIGQQLLGAGLGAYSTYKTFAG
jgi:hypothetical protein